MIRDALSNTRLLPTWQMARKISSISLGALLAISASFSARAYHFPWDQGHDVTRKQEAPESPEAGGCEDSLCQTIRCVPLPSGSR